MTAVGTAKTMMRKAVDSVVATFSISDSRAAGRFRAVLGLQTRANTPCVTIDSALQLGVVWACVRLIAETISTLPLITYKRKGAGRVVADEHPLYTLLHDSPNADMTAVEFWEAIVSQLCLWGNAFCYKTYGPTGDIVSIDPLVPALMTVRRMSNGALQYVYADPRGRQEWTEAEIWHIKGFGVDGLIGISPIAKGAQSMGGAMAADYAAAQLYGNNMAPVAVLTRDEFFDKPQRQQMKEKLQEGFFGGPETGGKMMLLEGGTKYQQLSMPPADAQLIENRQFSVEDLCRWFSVPPSMIGHGTAVSNWGTGREQINIGFLQYVLRPYMVRIEQGIRKSLLRPEERRKYSVEYSVEGLLRADSEARAAFYASAVQNGWMTRNEVRSLENWPEKDGGDDLTVQSNMIPVSLLGQGTTSTDATSAMDALKRALGIEDKNEP